MNTLQGSWDDVLYTFYPINDKHNVAHNEFSVIKD